MRSHLRSWPSVPRVLLAQGISFVLLSALARGTSLEAPSLAWALAQGLAATLAGILLALPPAWAVFQIASPLALDLMLRHQVRPGVSLALLLGLLLLFGGGVRSRVPLYHSTRNAWARLLDLVPRAPGTVFVDLGAGFGGPLAFLARHRPDGIFLGVEASPLSWLVATLRCLRLPNARIRLGSLWTTPLAPADVVFAFLSPAPMARLARKVQEEMKPGTLFVSHTFEAPGLREEARLPVKGRRDAIFHLYRIGAPPPAPEGS